MSDLTPYPDVDIDGPDPQDALTLRPDADTDVPHDEADLDDVQPAADVQPLDDDWDTHVDDVDADEDDES